MFLMLGVAHAATVTVTVEGVQPDTGVVGCSLFRAAEGFPEDERSAVSLQVAKPENGVAVCTFAGVEDGTVAVAVIHDLDGDLKLDRTWFGKPTEGYGFSNGAVATAFSAPKFEAAAVRVAGDQALRVALVY